MLFSSKRYVEPIADVLSNPFLDIHRHPDPDVRRSDKLIRPSLVRDLTTTDDAHRELVCHSYSVIVCSIMTHINVWLPVMNLFNIYLSCEIQVSSAIERSVSSAWLNNLQDILRGPDLMSLMSRLFFHDAIVFELIQRSVYSWLGPV